MRWVNLLQSNQHLAGVLEVFITVILCLVLESNGVLQSSYPINTDVYGVNLEILVCLIIIVTSLVSCSLEGDVFSMGGIGLDHHFGI